jgi:hypothetical protein
VILAALTEALDLEPMDQEAVRVLEESKVNVGYATELLLALAGPDIEKLVPLGKEWKVDSGYISTLEEGYPHKGKGSIKKLGNYRGAIVGIARQIARGIVAGAPYPWEEKSPEGKDQRVQGGQGVAEERNPGEAGTAEREPGEPQGGRAVQPDVPKSGRGQAGPEQEAQGVAGDARGAVSGREAEGAPRGGDPEGVLQAAASLGAKGDGVMDRLASLRLRWKPEQWERYMKGKLWVEATYKNFPKWADTYLTEAVETGGPIKKSGFEAAHMTMRRTRPEDIGQERML